MNGRSYGGQESYAGQAEDPSSLRFAEASEERETDSSTRPDESGIAQDDLRSVLSWKRERITLILGRWRCFREY